jgi:hypothetical protein
MVLASRRNDERKKIVVHLAPHGAQHYLQPVVPDHMPLPTMIAVDHPVTSVDRRIGVLLCRVRESRAGQGFPHWTDFSHGNGKISATSIVPSLFFFTSFDPYLPPTSTHRSIDVTKAAH